MLARKDQLPLGSFINPRHVEAEVLYADRQWKPVTVLGWHRLDVAHRQAVTDRWIFAQRERSPGWPHCWGCA